MGLAALPGDGSGVESNFVVRNVSDTVIREYGFSMTEVEPPEELTGVDLRTSAGVTRLADSYRVELASARAVSLVAR